jgi:hypothetical protein
MKKHEIQEKLDKANVISDDKWKDIKYWFM